MLDEGEPCSAIVEGVVNDGKGFRRGVDGEGCARSRGGEESIWGGRNGAADLVEARLV